MVKIIPVAMVKPNRACIYAPSRIRQSFWTKRTNLQAISNHSKEIQVSFAEDGISDPEYMTAYGYTWYCWFIVAPEEEGIA